MQNTLCMFDRSSIFPSLIVVDSIADLFGSGVRRGNHQGMLMVGQIFESTHWVLSLRRSWLSHFSVVTQPYRLINLINIWNVDRRQLSLIWISAPSSLKVWDEITPSNVWFSLHVGASISYLITALSIVLSDFLLLVAQCFLFTVTLHIQNCSGDA